MYNEMDSSFIMKLPECLNPDDVYCRIKPLSHTVTNNGVKGAPN